MLPFLASLYRALGCAFRTRVGLQLEILALRHQINALRRSRHTRVRLRVADRVMSKNPNQMDGGGPECESCLELGLAPRLIWQRSLRLP